MTTSLDLEQERLARLQEPCAVSVNGGPLYYGELTVECDEPADSGWTPYGPETLAPRLFLHWGCTVEFPAHVDYWGAMAAVRFGDTVTQPYEGRAYFKNVTARGHYGEDVVFIGHFTGQGDIAKWLG